MLDSHYSFYRVDKVEPGVALHLSNLVGDESVRVLEKDASIGIEGTLLYTGIATLQHITQKTSTFRSPPLIDAIPL